MASREKLYTPPPPPSPHFWPKRHFPREGGGGVYVEAPRGRNFIRPPPLCIRSEKWQNENSPNFSNFVPEFLPEFCSEFSPNFSKSFRALFPRKRRPEKIHQKSPPFFNAKFPGNYEKNIHKMFLESRQRNFLYTPHPEKGIFRGGGL